MKGFSTHYVSPTAITSPTEPQVMQVKGQSALVELLAVAIADTVPRLPFADAVTALDAALRGGDARPALGRDALQAQAKTIKHSRARRHGWRRPLPLQIHWPSQLPNLSRECSLRSWGLPPRPCRPS